MMMDNPSPRPTDFFGSGHPRLTTEKAKTLEFDNIHRIAFEISSYLADIPDSSGMGSAKPLMVGSYVFSPKTANDLDVEVFGVSWDDLQKWFSEHGPELVNDGVLASFFLTKGLDDGTIPQDRMAEGYGGNAYVAAWLIHASGRRINVSIPCKVDENTNRYNLNSVYRDPNLTPEEASLRRNFAHKTGFIDMMGHSLIDPMYGKEALENSKLIILDPAFRNDPLNLWGAVIEMGNNAMLPDAKSLEILIGMGEDNIDLTDAKKVDRERLQYERCRLLMGTRPPGEYLEIAWSIGAFKQQVPALHSMDRETFTRTITQANVAFSSAALHSEWGTTERAGCVLGAIGKVVLESAIANDRESASTVLNDFLTAFNFHEEGKESVYSLALKALE